jgi:hypothetical protein
MPTDTDERIVGKKKSVRRAMLALVFLKRKEFETKQQEK